MPPTNEEALFALALGKPPSERSAWLDRECGVDHALRARLDALLEAHEKPDDLLADPTDLTCSTVPCEFKEAPEAAVGMTLGRYKLREKLGEGGCGTVYVAEQTEPVRRRVALKVIKLGMDTKQVVARFEAERQALAMMDHPNIAKVLDAGTTEAGRPYFVMELVRGMRITEYCDQANLSTRERLDLFIKVCQAIQHAHQKGIIHRDIKPSNILVTLHDGVPVPKVIDFGIAKATEGRLTDNTVYTQLHQFIGTPAYMSPEQAEMSGLDIDTRSDIYSLGVLLYELLAGSTPFDAKELVASGLDAMRKTIREKEPVRPSTRLAALGPDELTTTAKRRSADTSKLLHQLKGDLDWIVMKCLEKDRQRRYETANGLAADIRRHLDNEPVTARPPSAVYRFQKTFRRNKALFGAIGAVVCALLVGLIVSSWQALRAIRASRSELGQRLVAEAARVEAQTKQREAEAERSRAQQEQQRADSLAWRAVENQEHSRRLLYAADMNLIQQALNNNNLGRARHLLDRHRPKAGEEDLRGWEWRYLWQLSRGDALAVLSKRQNARCTSVSFSPDGKLLASGYSDGRIELWDVTRRVLLRELNVDGPWARVVFSPSSNVLAATAGEGTIKLHDIASGRETILWQSRLALIKRLTATPDGSRLTAFITGPPGTSVVTFDMIRGVPVSTNSATRGDGEGGMLGVARLSSDKKRLFVGGAAGSGRRVVLKCLDVETDRELWETEVGVDGGMTAMALSPDDQVLVTGTGYQAGVLSVLDARTGKLITRLEGHSSWVTDLTFSRDGAWLAAAASEPTIRLWNTSNWKEPRTLRGNGDNVLSVEFSPDGRMLASGAKDGGALLWDIAPRASRYGHHLLPSDVTFVKEVTPGLAVATIGSREVSNVESRLLRLDGLELSPLGIETRQSSFFVPPNLISDYDQTNTLKLFEIRNVGLHPVGAVEVSTNITTAMTFAGTRATALIYESGRRLLAWGEGSNTVAVASLEQPGRGWRWASEFLYPVLRAFSPDGELLVVSKPPPAQEFEIREVKTGKQILRWNIAKSQPRVLFGIPTQVKFADGGRRFVAAGTDSEGMQVLFWDLADVGKPPVRFSERGGMRELSVSPDGRWVAAGTDASQVVIYDAVKRERRPEVFPGQSTAHSIIFSPDSRSVATGFQGLEAFKLWQMGTAQELLTFPGMGFPVDMIEFAENGDTLVVGSAGRRGTWHVWRAPSWEVIQATEAQALLTPGSASAGTEGSRQP